MGQSLAQIYLHLIFGTKWQKPLLDPGISLELFPDMISIMRSLECPVLAVNGTDDHVHILFKLSKKIALSTAVEKVKSNSSGWIKKKDRKYTQFYWQNGYGAFSIGQSGVKDLKRYIASQREHHKVKTFKEEFLEFLKAYKLEYDEKYLWDDEFA
ncbi:IS200/IS605 family transposase [candidate division CSSED10-310 bacterium]|uniref:IS200/IS605 family transposase n=1 Tax=candidate division CSSED10-310 bacterium TaxID=2855610 RepID=A0ABV6YSC9_UNCC1